MSAKEGVDYVPPENKILTFQPGKINTFLNQVSLQKRFSLHQIPVKLKFSHFSLDV